MRAIPSLLLAAFVLAPIDLAIARDVPQAGVFDTRLREVDYNANDVVQIVGAYGVSTHIQFDDDEKITNTAIGDSLAWGVAPVGNHLFIKPIEPNAHTNMTVLTNKRVYQFDLAVGDDAEPPYYGVVFRFPQQEMEEHFAAVQAAADAKTAADAAKRKAEEEETKRIDLQNAIENSDHAIRRNVNFWFKGSSDVQPDEAFDDGQFTYFKFRGNREMPVVYLEAGRGNESLVNTTVRGDTIVVQRLAPRFVLRKGEAVGLVVNQYYDKVGWTNDTGTVTPVVKREVLGNDKPKLSKTQLPNMPVDPDPAIDRPVTKSKLPNSPYLLQPTPPAAPAASSQSGVQVSPGVPVPRTSTRPYVDPYETPAALQPAPVYDRRALSPTRKAYLASIGALPQVGTEVSSTKPASASTGAAPKLIRILRAGDVYRAPRLDADKIGGVAANTSRTPIARNRAGDWFVVKLGGDQGETGWISRELVADDAGLMNLPIY